MKSGEKKNPSLAKKKSSYHHGQLREALLAESLRALQKKGPHELSLRRIATQLGVTPMAAYRHFADKEAVLAELAAQGFDKLTLRLRELKEKPIRGDEWFQDLAWAYVGLAVESPEHLQLMFGGFVKEFEKHPCLHDNANCSFQTLVEVIAVAQSQGFLKPGPTTIMAVTCWSLVHGLAMLMTDKDLSFIEGLPKTPREISDQLALQLLNGMKSPAGHSV